MLVRLRLRNLAQRRAVGIHCPRRHGPDRSLEKTMVPSRFDALAVSGVETATARLRMPARTINPARETGQNKANHGETCFLGSKGLQQWRGRARVSAANGAAKRQAGKGANRRQYIPRAPENQILDATPRDPMRSVRPRLACFLLYKHAPRYIWFPLNPLNAPATLAAPDYSRKPQPAAGTGDVNSGGGYLNV